MGRVDVQYTFSKKCPFSFNLHACNENGPVSTKHTGPELSGQLIQAGLIGSSHDLAFDCEGRER